MIANLKPYQKMKDSGVKWIGEVPAHWTVSRLRDLASMRVSNVDKHSRQNETPARLCNYVDVYHNERITPAMPFMHSTAAASQIERYRLQPGDVLITKDSEIWNDIGVPALVESADSTMICGYHLALLRPKIGRAQPGYLFRALQSTAVASQFHVRANGVTRFGLTQSAIKAVRIPVPPLTEQAAIARFLDHAVRRIQRYVSVKQKLITLLDEQKRGLILQAVTGRIDVRTGSPYPDYKPSRTAWLGDVPEHWDVAQLRRVAVARCDGPFGSELKSSHYTRDGVRVVRLQNIGHGDFRDVDAAFVSPDHYASLGEHSVIAHDVLIAGLGDGRHPPGRACVAPETLGPAMVKADCFRFRLNQAHAKPRFVADQLTATALASSAVLSTGATRQRTNLERTSARKIGIPTLDEQGAIVDHIIARTGGIRTLQKVVRREINLLIECRDRLIADVVTGKLDVRRCLSKS